MSLMATARREPQRPFVPARTKSSRSRWIIRFWMRTDWRTVMRVRNEKLLTPVGLRSLAPDDPEYKPIYAGDLRARDAAYHQGTVWAWLIGPFIDAWMKVHPDDKAGARKFLEVFPSISTRPASERSGKFSMPKSRIRAAVALRKRGALRKSCVAG